MDFWLFGQLFMLLALFIIVRTTNSSEYMSATPKDTNFLPNVWLWNVEEYPNPQEKPRDCRRYQKSFVCDPDDILEIEEANALDVLIQTVKDETPCLCSSCNSTNSGVTIGIALLKHIFLKYHAPPPEEIRIFAERLRQIWKLGNCDDDVLILISTGDQRSHTDVGSTIASLLPTETTVKIFLEYRNHFTNGNYYQGLESMIQSYSDIIRTEALHRSSAPKKHSSLNLIVGLTVTFILLVIVLASLAFWWTKRKRGRENDRRYSWEPSNSLKRADISKIQGPYVSVKTSDYAMPAMAEMQRERYLERLNEEEEIELEQMSEEEKHRLEDLSEDENVQLDLEEDESKLQEIEDGNQNETSTQKSDGEGEKYFMPRDRSQTQWQSVPQSEINDLENTKL